jgi:hypothetical protein
LFRGRASLVGATLEDLDETAVFGEISCNDSVMRGTVSPAASACSLSGQSVSVPVLDCSSYSSPAEMLSQDIEYPCIFTGINGCDGKVLRLPASFPC